jgi:hypothetical protein
MSSQRSCESRGTPGNCGRAASSSFAEKNDTGSSRFTSPDSTAAVVGLAPCAISAVALAFGSDSLAASSIKVASGLAPSAAILVDRRERGGETLVVSEAGDPTAQLLF